MMKIISVSLLLSFLIMVGSYFIFDHSVSMPVARNAVLENANSNIGKPLIPDRQRMVKPFVESVTVNVSSSEVENPYLPVAYSVKQHDNESVKNDDNVTAHRPLEEGQSRTFLYLSQHDAVVDPGELDSDSYFLQPGQSRTFLPLSDMRHISVEVK